MSQRYIDLSFEESNQSMLDGGFQTENNATVIRLKVLNASAKHYIEIERLNAKHDKYCSDELPVVDGYATLKLSRDYTNSTIYVQGVMKVDDICRKTPRMRLGFKRSINAIEELPESQPSWADSVESRLDELKDGLTPDSVLYTKQELTNTQKQQARENIGTMPKLFYKQGEELARVVKISDKGGPLGLEEFGFKDVVIFTQCYVGNNIAQCKYKVGRYGEIEFVENEADGTLTIKNYGTNWGSPPYDYSIRIRSSKRLFAGIWLVTLSIGAIYNSSKDLKEGDTLSTDCEITATPSLMPSAMVLGRGVFAQETIPEGGRAVYVTSKNEGYIYGEIQTVRSRAGLRQAIMRNDASVVVTEYDDSIADVIIITSSDIWDSVSVYYGIAHKNGSWGSYYIVFDNHSTSIYAETLAPDTLGITTAAAGQILRVKTVNEDDKRPMGWEAVNFPQADWEEQNEEADGFIRNKPEWREFWVDYGDGSGSFCGIESTDISLDDAFFIALDYMPYLYVSILTDSGACSASVLSVGVTDQSVRGYYINPFNDAPTIECVTVPWEKFTGSTGTGTSTSTEPL